jgi:hypothetical protein
MFGFKRVVKILAPNVKVNVDTTDSTSFDFAHNKIIIGYDFNDDEFGFNYHLKTAHKCKFADKISNELWTILHELGHYYANAGIEDEEQAQFVRSICAILGDDIVKGNREVQAMYYNLPSEWTATEWAIDFVRKNKWKVVFLNFLAKF